MDYRRDIDGLRAVAVTAVILFHMDETWLPGGFAGVDIFFVISGYLITTIIAADLAQNRFSLTGFFVRRVRRIIPVLACVTIVTLLVGHFLLVPDHLRELAWSAVFSMLSAANIFFTYGVDGGYFAEDGSTRPLLHIWSLGVEEQFYLIWPIVLAASWAILTKRQIQVAVTTLALAGLLLSEWLARTTPEFAYYMLPGRAFELLIGACLALNPKAASAVYGNNIAAVAAAGLLAFGLWAIDPTDVFPGLAAVPTTLGAAVLIATGGGGGSVVSKALSWAPVVMVGRISYSLYLWHWPVLAFMRYVYIETTPFAMLAAAVVMFGLSAASYRYVEVPCRQSRLPPRHVFARMFVAPAAIVGVLSASLVASDGLGGYAFSPAYAARMQDVDESMVPPYKFPFVCQRYQVAPADLVDRNCVINGSGAEEPKILLWGDSNAAHYVALIRELANRQGFAFRNIEHSACAPVLNDGYTFSSKDYRLSCRASHKVVLPALAKYDTLMISAQWTHYDGFSDAFKAELIQTVELLSKAGTKIVLIGQINPAPKSYDRRCSEKAAKVSFIDCSEVFRDFPMDERVAEINAWLASLADKYELVTYVDFNRALCPAGCSPFVGSEPVYFDRGHLSVNAATLIGKMLAASGFTLPL